MKLIDQWNELKNRLEQDDSAFLKANATWPKSLYRISSSGEIIDVEIGKMTYWHRTPANYLEEKKRPTRKKVAELIKYMNQLERVPENIRLHYSYVGGLGKYSAACDPSKLAENKLFKKKADAEMVAEERRERRKREEAHRESGGKFCAYCGEIIPIGEEVVGVVIARQYAGMRKESAYCSEICNTHDQMAHEG